MAHDHERRWRNALPTRERDFNRTLRLSVVLLWIVAAVAPFTLYLLQQMEYVRVRYRIEELRSQHGRLVEMEQRLRIERAALTTPARVERCAIRDLGLVRPMPTRVVVVQHPVRDSEGLMARAPDGP